METNTGYELLIWDKGPGIPKYDLQNVFKRMYRSEQSRNPSTVVVASDFLFLKPSLKKMVGVYGLTVFPGNELLLVFPCQNTLLLRNS